MGYMIIETTVRYLSVDIEDALRLSEHTKIRPWDASHLPRVYFFRGQGAYATEWEADTRQNASRPG